MSLSPRTLETVWLGIGFAGQGLFTARFLVQWAVSEKKRDSVVPVAFWWLSLGGGLVLLSYAVYRRDPVIILGQGTGLFVYVRNLMLVKQGARRRAGTAGRLDEPSPALAPPHPGRIDDPSTSRRLADSESRGS